MARVSRLEFEDLLNLLQQDCESTMLIEIENLDPVKLPTYCLWSTKMCQASPMEWTRAGVKGVSLSMSEIRIHLDVLEVTESENWLVSSFWEEDGFPFTNCPLQYLATCASVTDASWRLDVLQSHKELADILETACKPSTIN